MKFSIVHMSDLHISVANNTELNEKAKAVNEFLKNNLETNDIVFLVVTGDIAYSGKDCEYDNAKFFFNKVKNGVLDKDRRYILFTPGNHDCNFDLESESRKFIINEIKEEKITFKLVNELTQIQEGYFKFAREASKGMHDFGKLNSKEYFTFNNGELNITFNLLNTAWMSKIHEDKNLIMPTKLLNLKSKNFSISPNGVNLVVTAFHHPTSWLNSMNDMALKKILESESDIILTGHEHTEDVFQKLKCNKNVFYDCGAEFRNVDPEFTLITVDTQLKKGFSKRVIWNKKETKFVIGETLEFIFDKKSNQRLDERTLDFLNDLGMIVNHKRKKNIVLSDIYVTPTLTKNDRENPSKLIKGKEIIREIADVKKIMIEGDSGTGKTSLLKYLFNNYFEKGFLPIFIHGNDLKTASEVRFDKLINSTIPFQYANKNTRDFNEFPYDKRVLLIDDFHLINKNSLFRSKLFNLFSANFGRIVISNNNFYSIQFDFDSEKFLSEFTSYKIEDFSRKLRYDLIMKWYKLENYDDSDDEILSTVIRTEELFDKLIRNNNMPSNPSIIITLLNANEIRSFNGHEKTLYGHLLQMLITHSLNRSGIDSDDLDEVFSILDRFAYSLFKQSKKIVDYTFIKDIISTYNVEFGLDINCKEVIKRLINANVLKVDLTDIENANIAFKYTYLYSYFVAQYISKHLSESEIIQDLDNILKWIHLDENVKIFINIWYFTHNNILFEKLENKIYNVLKYVNVYEFEKPAKCISDILSRKRDIISELKTIDNNYKVHYEEKLEIEEINEYENRSDLNSLKESNVIQENDEINEILSAMNLISVIGQITKTSSGTMNATQKEFIIKSSYTLGMKVLNYLFNIFDKGGKDFIESASEILVSDEITPEKAYQQTIETFQKMLRYSSIAIIMFISDSISNDKLKITFKKILKENEKIAFRLIDVCISFSYQNLETVNDVFDLSDDLENDIFAKDVLVAIIWQYYYYHPAKNPFTRQKILNKLKIKSNVPKLLSNK